MEVTLSHILLREIILIKTFLPVLRAVTFFLPCHHKVSAQEVEWSDYHCAWQGLFAAAITTQSDCYFCLHSTAIKKKNPRYQYMLNTPILHCLNFEQITHFNVGVALFLMQNYDTSFEILTFCTIKYMFSFSSAWEKWLILFASIQWNNKYILICTKANRISL